MRVSQMFEAAPVQPAPPAVPVLALPEAQQKEALALIKDPGQLEGFRALVAELRSLQAHPALTKLPQSREECHVLSELVVTAAKVGKSLDQQRANRVKPYNDVVKRINGLLKPLIDEAEAARVKGDRWFLEFQKVERARVEREQQEARRQQEEAARAEQAAAEKLAEATRAAETAKTAEELEAAEAAARKAAEEAEAASRAQSLAVVAEPEQVLRGYRGDAGTLSLVEKLKLDSFDPDKIPADVWRDPSVLEAVRKVLAKRVRAGMRDIPGCVIVPEEGTRAR